MLSSYRRCFIKLERLLGISSECGIADRGRQWRSNEQRTNNESRSGESESNLVSFYQLEQQLSVSLSEQSSLSSELIHSLTGSFRCRSC